MKEETYRVNENAQSLCSSEVLALRMGVQSVLLASKLQVSVQYYTTSHYIAITIASSCLLDLFNNKLSQGYKNNIVSDDCCYQNRNKVLSSAQWIFSTENNVEVKQIILEKRHTMMQLDSIHSTLESLFKPPIYVPNDYINLTAQAGPSNL